MNQSGEFAALLEEFARKKEFVEGTVIKGKVVGFESEYVLLDVNLKSEGKVPLKEFETSGQSHNLKIGDEIDVYVERYEDRSGGVVLSRERAIRDAAWTDLEKACKENTDVTGIIIGRVRGGYTVDLNGVIAFLPGSQLDTKYARDAGSVMNVPLEFQVLKMDRIRGNIVVSRKSVIESSEAAERVKLMDNLTEGQIINGVVKNITSYGAFVDIGGIDGLLHNIDMSWKRLNHASEVLQPGQRVKVKVLRYNRESQRVSLGMKQLEDDPWIGIEHEVSVGSRLSGIVTNVTDYGVFVEIKPGVEGLVHVSEVSWKKNVHPTKVLSVAQTIDVVVLDVDVSKRRIGLGIKQLTDNPWKKIEQDFPIGTEFEGEITNILDFGLFVRMTPIIDGMVHVNDLSWEKHGDEALRDYKKGDIIKVKVLEIEAEKERIALGIKQLSEDPYKEIFANVKKGSVVTCTITSVLEEGLEVALSSGLSGFIKRSELAKDRRDRRSDRFAVGEKIDAKIVSVDRNAKKVSLSIKSLEIEEEKQVMAEYGSSNSGASLGDILGSVDITSKKKS